MEGKHDFQPQYHAIYLSRIDIEVFDHLLMHFAIYRRSRSSRHRQWVSSRTLNRQAGIWQWGSCWGRL